jgi:hypothetical protein
MLKKKIWASFLRIIELFTQKIVTKFSKIWVWDPGSILTMSVEHWRLLISTAYSVRVIALLACRADYVQCKDDIPSLLSFSFTALLYFT